MKNRCLTVNFEINLIVLFYLISSNTMSFVKRPNFDKYTIVVNVEQVMVINTTWRPSKADFTVVTARSVMLWLFDDLLCKQVYIQSVYIHHQQHPFIGWTLLAKFAFSFYFHLTGRSLNVLWVSWVRVSYSHTNMM